MNYGRPYKLNTAEAMAACLYICRRKEDAKIVLSSFSYGEEFIKLNLGTAATPLMLLLQLANEDAQRPWRHTAPAAALQRSPRCTSRTSR